MPIGATVVPLRPAQFRLNASRALLAGQQGAAREMERFLRYIRVPAPPKTPTTYQRTGHIGESWFMRDVRGIATDVYNTADYANLVHGNNKGIGQLAMHAETGWLNMYREFQKYKPRIIAAAQSSFVDNLE